MIVADDSHRELVELGSAPLANLLGFFGNLCAKAATDRHLGAFGVLGLRPWATGYKSQSVCKSESEWSDAQHACTRLNLCVDGF